MYAPPNLFLPLCRSKNYNNNNLRGKKTTRTRANQPHIFDIFVKSKGEKKLKRNGRNQEKKKDKKKPIF
jgi:hypothetical protein